MLVNFKRILKYAFADFYRNKGISVAAVFVLTSFTMLITGLFLVRGAGVFLVQTIESKIDVTAYFKEEVPEEDILNAKSEIMRLVSEIKEVRYISKEDALNDFTQKHKDNDVLLVALAEAGGNPFLPSLNITTGGEVGQYEKIDEILQSGEFGGLIEKIDFSQKKDTIQKVFSIIGSVNRFGIGLGAVLALIAAFVVFSTVKLAVENSRDEINTMKIVGAPHWFIKAPFVAQGAIFGFISLIVCLIIALLSAYFIAPRLAIVMPGFNLFGYLVSNFWIIVLIQLGFGAGLAIISSLIAVNRCLKH